jgi:hypothetical protein
VRAAVFAISFVASCAAVGLSGLLAAFLQGWFGVSDLSFLLTWFVPAGLTTAALTSLAMQSVSRWPLLLRYVVGVGLGLALGFLWTFVVARFMGPWWGAVSLPALMCWMAGGASGVAGGFVLGPGSSTGARIAGIAGLVVVCAAGVVLSQPLGIQLDHDQALTVRFLRWTPGREPLTIETERVDGIQGVGELNDAEVAVLRAAQPTGRVFVVWGGSRHGRGPSASALIVLKEPIRMRTRIQQPDRTTVVYLQNEHGFSVHPPAAKTLEREIILSPQQNGVWCSVRIANGGVQSGPVRIWREGGS